jgi:hypothetical protein
LSGRVHHAGSMLPCAACLLLLDAVSTSLLARQIGVLDLGLNAFFPVLLRRVTCCQLLQQLLVLPVSADLLQQTACPQTSTAPSTQVTGQLQWSKVLWQRPVIGSVFGGCLSGCLSGLPSPSKLPHDSA